MAIKKQAATEVAEMKIEEVAELFQKYATEKKSVEEKEKQYKKMLIEYAELHPKEFDGKTLKFPNGVYVEERERMKSNYNEDDVTVSWIDNFVKSGGENAISIKFDDKKIASGLDAKAEELLAQIDYEILYETTYAAYAK
ncbi:MAG: hypothetical protein FWH36_02255 [Lentimicrobiaceae bacterium]|nr:hypothetical protein [Lentimicrobiaceae bacterium]